MKKIKHIVVLILSLACLLLLFGCGNRADGYYVKDSFECNPHYYSSLEKVSASVKFDVYLPEAKKYEITYTLVLYNGTQKIAEKTFTETCTSIGKQTVGISEYWSTNYSANNVDDNYLRVEISKLTANVKAADTSYIGLSIGFGITGGLIFIGLLALYICLNIHSGKNNAA